MLGVCDAAEAVDEADDVAAAADCDVVDMVVVVGVNEDVVGDEVDAGRFVDGVVTVMVSCNDPEGPIPMR